MPAARPNLRPTSACAAVSAAAAAVLSALLVTACQKSQTLTPGQTSFTSAPAGRSGGSVATSGGPSGASGNPVPATAPGNTTDAAQPARTVQETDLYRLDGDRLYTLNSYRGLMVFDLSDIDHPKLLGRSPIAGSPVEMVVRGGIASVVVADWAGVLEDGSPFHGSIVRALDARDPAHIALIGEVHLGGWVRDVRLVGDVLYAVSQDYGWYYGDNGGGTGTAGLIVSSVQIPSGPGDSTVHQNPPLRWDGWDGVFNVHADSILLARPEYTGQGNTYQGRTRLTYLDISDPAGKVVERGSVTVDGRVQGWGPDNGRFNLDFDNHNIARTVGCGLAYCDEQAGYVLATADFSDPDHPKLRSQLAIPGRGWQPAVRFDGSRLYLSAGQGFWQAANTPFSVYDVTSPDAPKFAGSSSLPGTVWSFFPAGDRLFALGNRDAQGGGTVTLNYLDVSDPRAPQLLGTAAFGQGWAWTPAAGTFKAFTRDPAQGLVVLPFSSWSEATWKYTNGLQLIEFGDRTIRTAGAGFTQGWVERGVFAKGRLLSISDLSLAVIDPSDHDHPKVLAELTLARNVIAAVPTSSAIVASATGDRQGPVAVVSGDFWEQDRTRSELRLLRLADAEEDTLPAPLATVPLEGTQAQVFAGPSDLIYVVTVVQRPIPCVNGAWQDPQGRCLGWTNLVTVDDASFGQARVRGTAELPVVQGWWWPWWGWFGCFWWDWFGGAEVVLSQAPGGDALAFRRWMPGYDGHWNSARESLFVVDLSQPDAPAVSSTVITDDPTGWWGNLVAVGNQLYTSHYEWDAGTRSSQRPWVRYYLDRIDLTDRAHPKVTAKVNVPGVVVGASAADPSVIYTADWLWTDEGVVNTFSALRLGEGVATLLGSVSLDGWVGRVIVRGERAWFTTQRYEWDQSSGPRMAFRQLDLRDPAHPALTSAPPRAGWGWLLDVQGDRAIVTSGWGSLGIDLYALADGAAPRFEQTVRARGWGASSVSRAGDTLLLASGYWGVQLIDLQPSGH